MKKHLSIMVVLFSMHNALNGAAAGAGAGAGRGAKTSIIYLTNNTGYDVGKINRRQIRSKTTGQLKTTMRETIERFKSGEKLAIPFHDRHGSLVKIYIGDASTIGRSSADVVPAMDFIIIRTPREAELMDINQWGVDMPGSLPPELLASVNDAHQISVIVIDPNNSSTSLFVEDAAPGSLKKFEITTNPKAQPKAEKKAAGAGPGPSAESAAAAGAGAGRVTFKE